MTNTLSAGQDVLSYCGKCKLALNHTIVTMKSSKTIGKCECNTCKAQHAYKDPTKVGKKTTGTKSKTTTVPVEVVWEQALKKASGEAKTYSIKGTFSEGDILDHTKFGKGVVEKRLDIKKIQVIFESDIKTLISPKSD